MFVALLLAPLAGVGTSARGQSPEPSWAEVARRGRAATALVTLLGPSGEKMIGEASAFCVHPSGLFVTNHHAIRDILPPGSIAAIVRPSTARGLTQPTSPESDPIPITVPAEARPRVRLILNSNRPDQRILDARVLWTDPDSDLALLRRGGQRPARPVDRPRIGPDRAR